jgi:hypothetical protein
VILAGDQDVIEVLAAETAEEAVERVTVTDSNGVH